MKVLARAAPIVLAIVGAFSFTAVPVLRRPSSTAVRSLLVSRPSTSLQASAPEDVSTVQILMSDTGGGHRASANALRDAFDVLHPGKIQCDIVDIYTCVLLSLHVLQLHERDRLTDHLLPWSSKQ